MLWFLKEQVEEVASMSTLLNVAQRAGHDWFDVETYLAREAVGDGGADADAPAAAGGELCRHPVLRGPADRPHRVPRRPTTCPGQTDADGGQALAEFAGRACYQSWSKPVPATATNAGYLDHILQVGHLSVLEHSSATFYITGISRSVTHELIRHRHFSLLAALPALPAAGRRRVVEPAIIAADPELHEIFTAPSAVRARPTTRCWPRWRPTGGVRAGRDAGPQTGPAGGTGGAAERHHHRDRGHRELPGLAALHRDAGNRGRRPRYPGLAVALLLELQALAPNVFADFRISQLGDGTDVAASPLVGEG